MSDRALIPSTMQDYQLTLTAMLRHATQVHPDGECLTWTGDGVRRASYAEVAAGASRLAWALRKLGVEAGDRVGTLCWNHQEHLEAYYAVPCMGAVLHTLNPRLPLPQLVSIINQAQDRFIMVDAEMFPLLAAVADQIDLDGVIVVGEPPAERLGKAPIHKYADIISGEEPVYPWPEIDEHSAAAICFTSGTTGDPKGVVYSHRSNYLHALTGLTNTILGSAELDRVLPMVPMFHVNAWGLPYGSVFAGATLLMPGRFLQPEHITKFVAQERATVIAGVPTLFAAILAYGESHEIDLSSVRLANLGGAATPRSMLEAFQHRYGLRIVQGWGMTETSPLGGIAHPPAGIEHGSAEDIEWRTYSARTAPGVEMRIVDTAGRELPRDGVSSGELEVRGPWITGSYIGNADPDRFHDGWLRTGDVATLDWRGYLRITDRVKDVIKSGGEWISSVELEDRIAAHPEVAAAAVIGVPDPRWDERPLACVTVKPGGKTTATELAEFLAAPDKRSRTLATWQIPDYWTFVPEIPLTSVGKYDKKVLRARYAAGDLEVETVHRESTT